MSAQPETLKSACLSVQTAAQRGEANYHIVCVHVWMCLSRVYTEFMLTGIEQQGWQSVLFMNVFSAYIKLEWE